MARALLCAMPSRARAVACLVAVAVLPVAALAQSGPAPAGGDSNAPAGATGSTGAEAPSASASSARPVYTATGYGWSPPPQRPHGSTAHSQAHRSRSGEPDSATPGFETLADGSTRLFVELSRPVTYAAKAGHGTITYVLKGAHVGRWNNTNPLVTVHFNTPVTEARLVPHGRDLWFVVDLRANVQPSVSVDAAKDGGSILRIAFAKGDYLPAGVAPPEPAPSASAAP